MGRFFCEVSLHIQKRYWDQQTWTSFCLAKLCDSCFRQSSYIYRNTVLLMIMGQNWGYESGFYVIISNQPYWNYHGFCLSGGPCKVFQCPGGQRKLLHCCLLVGISTQADTELFVTWQERQRKFLCIIKFFYLYIF